jgi:hypothetical protein
MIHFILFRKYGYVRSIKYWGSFNQSNLCEQCKTLIVTNNIFKAHKRTGKDKHQSGPKTTPWNYWRDESINRNDTTYSTIQGKQVFNYSTQKFYLIILNANSKNEK